MATRPHGEVTVVEVSGRLDAAVEEVRLAVPAALADEPRAVVVDLSGTQGEPAPDSVVAIAELGSYPRDWPAVPVAVVSPDECVRAALGWNPIGGHLVVSDGLEAALAALSPAVTPPVARLRLAPHPTAGRAARIFVARSCLDWAMTQGLAGACLVAGELVTNTIVRTRAHVDVSLSRHESLLRFSVRDHDSHLLGPDDVDSDQMRGRYVLVEGFSRAWGMLPVPGAGKVVWAVIDG